MIVTLTPNPSLDRTIALADPLARGQVQRALSSVDEPGGKGVNVARVVTSAGRSALAVLPAHHDDPVLHALRERGVAHRTVAVDHDVRANVTITEPDGTTTKLNMPGQKLSGDVLSALAETLHREAAGARWAALSGSLPPGVPENWYADLTARLGSVGCRVAVDTSGAPLAAALAPGLPAYPYLIKPNGEELAETLDLDPTLIEREPVAAARAALVLHSRGVAEVLVTLGSAGAVLVSAGAAWHATAPTVAARSTVGAGDSALAGYLLAETDGAEPADRLRAAVAYGSAAASLPGSTLPTPDQVTPAGIAVTTLPL
jgi:1-phosphofructokinase